MLHSSTDVNRGVDAPVIIIGAGPVGLATALGLAHHGVTSILIEREGNPVRESRAFGIWPRTLEILRNWGGLDTLLEAGTLYKTLEPVDARNEHPLFSFHFEMLDEMTAVAGAMIMPQNATERVLRSLVQQKRECNLRTAECFGIEQDGEGVTVHIREGESEQVLRAFFVVACDGAHSIVRKALGLELKGETYPTRMVLSDERINEEGLGRLRFAVHRPSFLASVRFAPNLWRVMATVPSSVSDTTALTEPFHTARVHDLFGERVHETIWINQFRLYRRHVERFRIGRVLLAGDAAHLNSPAGGQGMNSGIQDAENAVWKLAAAINGGDMERLLDSYHQERWEAIVSHVEQNSDRNTHLEFGMPAFLKPALLALLGYAIQIPPLGVQFARNFSMLDTRYTHSSLLVGRHRLVGTHLDDGRIDGQRRVSDFLKGRAGIVAVQTPSLGNAIDGIPVVHVPNALKTWGLRGPICIFVRPDQYVGAVVEEPTTEMMLGVVNAAFGRTSRERVKS